MWPVGDRTDTEPGVLISWITAKDLLGTAVYTFFSLSVDLGS